MGNQSFKSELVTLERKVKLLIAEFSGIKKENEKLRFENTELKKQLVSKDAQLSGFQNQRKITKIVDNMVVGTEEATGIREAIDDYIKEIDKCIAHLGEA